MEKFKIDLFEKETGELFPSFQKLNQTDCNICYQHFRKNIKVSLIPQHYYKLNFLNT
mgnify:CR=1 FL=1